MNLNTMTARDAVGFSPRVVTPRPDRRKDGRKPALGQAVLRVFDALGGGKRHEIQTRDLPLGGISFLLRENLSVGQACEIETGRARRKCEVVRSRALSNGRFEITVHLRESSGRR
jgi:hypothetical protein